MSDYTAKRIKDMEAGFGGGFVKARAELGVSAFGMQIIQLPPDYARKFFIDNAIINDADPLDSPARAGVEHAGWETVGTTCVQ